MSQLDCQSRLVGSRTGGKDVQDQLGAIQYLGGRCFLEIPNLSGSEIIVKDHDVSGVSIDNTFQLLDLAFAKIGRMVGSRPSLDQLVDNLSSSGRCQAMQFLKRIILDRVARQDQPCQDATLRRIISDLNWFTHDGVEVLQSIEKVPLQYTS